MGFLSVRFVLALVALLAGAGIAVMAWPHLGDSLTLSASVTAPRRGEAARPDAANLAVERWRDTEGEIGKAGAALGAARASEREGLQVLMTEREAHRVKQRATVKAPPGATLYSIVVGSVLVGAGDPIAVD